MTRLVEVIEVSDPAPDSVARVVGKITQSESATCTLLADDTGSHNLGLWKVSGATCTLFLKIIPHPDDDIDDFVSLLSRDNRIIHDRRFMLPHRILTVMHNSQPLYFALVSKFIDNATTLADYLAEKWFAKSTDEMTAVCERFGEFLRGISADYSAKLVHNDMTPSNALIANDDFFLIDCVGMSDDGLGDDCASFLNSIDLLGVLYGPEFTLLVSSAFLSGYQGT